MSLRITHCAGCAGKPIRANVRIARHPCDDPERDNSSAR
jgi:hypothetical protein